MCKIKVRKILALILGVTVWPISGFADDPFALNGYYKSFFVVFDPPNFKTPLTIPDQPVIGAVNNRIRLKLFCHPNEWLSFNAAYDFSPRIQDPSLFSDEPILVGIDPVQSGYRALDFNDRLYPSENDAVGSFGIFHNLDRASITLRTARADLIIGRQAIAWGSARVLNPTDVIVPFTFEELDKEERTGVDALRLRAPLSALAELDGGYVFGKDFQPDKSAFFVRSKFYIARTDIALLLLGFQENFLAGFDLARAIGGAGFWLEGAYVFVGAFDDDDIAKANDNFRGTIGFDYSFSGRTYGFLEYHFSGAGANEPENYLSHLSSPAFAEGAVYLLGKHYLAPGLTHQISPLVALSGQALFNLSDRSIFLAPQLEYNIAQNIYLAAGAFVGIGKRPELVIEKTGTPGIKLHSEFGSYPDFYFSSFRIYF
jgi:hypothetical protein